MDKPTCDRCGKSEARYSLWIVDDAYDVGRTHIDSYLHQPVVLFNLCIKCHGELVDWLWKGGAVQKFSDSLWKDFCEEHGVEYNV